MLIHSTGKLVIRTQNTKKQTCWTCRTWTLWATLHPWMLLQTHLAWWLPQWPNRQGHYNVKCTNWFDAYFPQNIKSEIKWRLGRAGWGGRTTAGWRGHWCWQARTNKRRCLCKFWEIHRRGKNGETALTIAALQVILKQSRLQLEKIQQNLCRDAMSASHFCWGPGPTSPPSMILVIIS